MDSFEFPQGKYSSSFYADYFGTEREDFQAWVHANDIPHVKVMKQMYVDSSEIWDCQRNHSIELIEQKRKKKEESDAKKKETTARKRRRKRLSEGE